MAYPAEPFKQADSLLTGLMESYRGSRDAADMMDIQSLLDTTMRIARDREYNVQQSIKGTHCPHVVYSPPRLCCCAVTITAAATTP
jgi:hypothetical protein